jgi:hypothetical protein
VARRRARKSRNSSSVTTGVNGSIMGSSWPTTPGCSRSSHQASLAVAPPRFRERSVVGRLAGLAHMTAGYAASDSGAAQP